MHLKPQFVYENKTVFICFLMVSGILHLIFIFSTSNMSHLLKPSVNVSDYGTEKSNYVVEIDLGSGEPKEESVEDNFEEEIAEELPEEEVEEEEWVEDDVYDEDRQLFVDTSGNAVDEETQAETDRIGEKGSIARDMYSGEDNINDEPRLEGGANFPGEVPKVLATTVSQESGLPIDVSVGEPGEPVEDVVEEAVEEMFEKETATGLAEVDNSEELPVNEEVQEFDETEDESVVQDISAEDTEEMTPHDLSSQDTEPVENTEEIVSTELESDVIIMEAESVKSDKTDIDVVEEIEVATDPVEKYTETVSTPETSIKEIVEDREENITNNVQNEYKTSDPQIDNVPSGNNDPFFEDNISNASKTGAESFNVKKHEYAPYYKHIKDKIRLYWLLQYGTDASINQVTKGYKPVVVTFKVLPSGKILNVKIADPAGNVLLASKIKKSIQNTILNKFPDYITDKHIDIKFSYFFF